MYKWLNCKVVKMEVGFLLLMAVYMLGTVSGMSTCRTVDMEMVKKKRIEAIRSQILSKLRLPKAPEPDESGDKEVIPTNLISLYNSTKDMLTEQEVEVPKPTEQVEEEYFAKVLHQFNMTRRNHTSISRIMYFNISAVRSSVGDDRLLTSADLRLLIKNPTILGEQRVELYYSTKTSVRYHASHFISNAMKDKWISFDVTKPLRSWLQDSEDEPSFHLRVFCECGQPVSTFNFVISGMGNGRGDTGAMSALTEKPPYILTMSIPQNMSSHLTSRKKRSTTSTQTENCAVKPLYIDFRKDLGWKWIHQPTGYYANYCMGSCTFIWNAENKYSQILALYQHHNPGASAQPCCVPQALHSLPIIYYVGRQHKVENLSNMIVSSCKCS